MKQRYIFDMETMDPDDFLTLILLLGHPRVELAGVTITPGSAHQVGLVRWALAQFGVDIPVGARNIDHPKTCVSSWHHKAFGAIPASRDAIAAGPLLAELCDARTTLVTGAPPKNLGAAVAVRGESFTLGRWVAQGGFAGEGVVPRAQQLEKFKGMETCPTFNLNGAPKEVMQALAHGGIGEKRFVSKNVCHGVVYGESMHAALAPLAHRARHLELIWHGMETFLQKKRDHRARGRDIEADSVRVVDAEGTALGVMSREEALAKAWSAGCELVCEGPDATPPFCRFHVSAPSSYGKKLHDPLAACCAIEPEIGEWAEVTLFRKRGGWGSRLTPGSGVRIITGYDPERFFSVLTEV